MSENKFENEFTENSSLKTSADASVTESNAIEESVIPNSEAKSAEVSEAPSTELFSAESSDADNTHSAADSDDFSEETAINNGDSLIKESSVSSDGEEAPTTENATISESSENAAEENTVGENTVFASEDTFENELDAEAEAVDGETPEEAESSSDNENSEECFDEDKNEEAEEAEYNGDTEAEDGKKAKAKENKSRAIDSLFDFVELFIFSLAAVFVITTFFFRHSVVDGSSMERTLFDGEHIIISDLFYKPERGDIIVCEDYSTELPIPIVKRVIGVAGDRVEIDAAGNVKVNGVLLDESNYVYIDPHFPYVCDPIDVTVPEGEIFVMGDHRNVSSDSRKIGTIKEDSILGKVLFRFYPFDKFGAVE